MSISLSWLADEPDLCKVRLPGTDRARPAAATLAMAERAAARVGVTRVADVTRLAYYRGEPFAWAWLANEGHPAYMGHITMAEMMAPLLTGVPRTYPE